MNPKVNLFSERNPAIDILRALTMLLMIFVNDLWRIYDEPYCLGHAVLGEDMLGLADVVFPCFLFAVGMSIPYAIENRFAKGKSGVSTVAHILTRTFALLVMGIFIENFDYGISDETGLGLHPFRVLSVLGFFLVWNVYPKTEKKHLSIIFRLMKISGIIILLYLAIIFRNADGGVLAVRWWGILGLIGWAYLFCAFVYLLVRSRLKYLIPIWIFLVAVCILNTTTIEGNTILGLPQKNILDDLLGILHLGNGATAAFTMSGIILSVICVKYNNISNAKKTVAIIIVSCIFLLFGFLSNHFWIISKIASTPPWLFYCIGIAGIAYGLIFWMVKQGKTAWFDPIKPAGTATLTCYLLPYLLYAIMTAINFPEWALTGYFGILNSIIFSFLTIGITGLLGRVNIKLKI